MLAEVFATAALVVSLASVGVVVLLWRWLRHDLGPVLGLLESLRSQQRVEEADRRDLGVAPRPWFKMTPVPGSELLDEPDPNAPTDAEIRGGLTWDTDETLEEGLLSEQVTPAERSKVAQEPPG